MKVHATSSIILLFAVSSNKIATSHSGTQDGVNAALTKNLQAWRQMMVGGISQVNCFAAAMLWLVQNQAQPCCQIAMKNGA
jgi:hypothetical protein